MPQPDALLSRMLQRVEEAGEWSHDPVNVTVILNGTMITGELVCRDKWRKESARQLKRQILGRSFAADFEDEGLFDGEEQHLHLRGGKAIHGNVTMPSAGGLFRMALSEISGWTVGEIGSDGSLR